MIYPQRDNKRKRKARWVIFGTLGFLLVIVLILNFFAPHAFTPLAQGVGKPLALSRNFVAGAFSGIFADIQTKRSLYNENKGLKEKLALMDAVIVERNALSDETTALKALIGRGEIPPTTVVAKILSKPGYSPYDTIIVDMGTKNGVAVGDIIVADQSVILGEVSAVFAHTATVVLYSTAEYKTNVFIGPKNLETTAVGKGGGTFEVRLPRNADVSEGDTVTLAAAPDKVFGSVTSINASSADSFERVLFRNAVDVALLRFVTIVKKAL